MKASSTKFNSVLRAVFAAGGLLVAHNAHAQRPLVVISVDGLDHRYLRDADSLGLKAPHMRRLATTGEWANGVVGVLSTITWPSHTTLITGKRPDQHGILSNRRPKDQGGDYYWTVDLLKADTLWAAAERAGLKAAAITWPVTVDAKIAYNLPEAFSKRQGGWMDLATIRGKATPGLVEKIIRFDKTFDQEWMDDRTRALATVYLLKREKPDLILLHFVDHDAVAHDHGPFTPEALAELERTDTYIGQILAALPKGATVCLTSDHGFERIDRVVNAASFPGKKRIFGGLAFALDREAADAIPEIRGIGRQVGRTEVAMFAPGAPEYVAAYEPATNHQFGYSLASTERYLPPPEKGNHGFWPLRPDYRSTFALWRAGQPAARIKQMDMLEIAPLLAAILGVTLN